jgi:hypothetical protein
MHVQNQNLHVDQGFCGLILPSFKQNGRIFAFIIDSIN